MTETPKREPHPETDRFAQRILDACFEVHRVLGPGFLESTYEEALTIEMSSRGLGFERQRQIGIDHKGRRIADGRLGFLVEKSAILEIKAVEALADIHRAQSIPYLKMTGCHLGLLVNFNVPLLKNGVRRVIPSSGPWRRGVVAVHYS